MKIRKNCVTGGYWQQQLNTSVSSFSPSYDICERLEGTGSAALWASRLTPASQLLPACCLCSEPGSLPLPETHPPARLPPFAGMLFILTGKNIVLISHMVFKKKKYLFSTSSYLCHVFLYQEEEAFATWHHSLPNEFEASASQLSLRLESWTPERWCLWSVSSCTSFTSFVIFGSVDTQTKSQYPTSALSTSLPLRGGTSLHPSHPIRSSRDRGSALSCNKNAQFSGCILFLFFQHFFSLNTKPWLLLEADCQSFKLIRFSLEISYLANFLFVTGS